MPWKLNVDPLSRANKRSARVLSVWHFGDVSRHLCLHEILLRAEVLDDEVLPLRRVLAHEEGEEFVGAVEVVEVDRGEADVLADEVLELAGGDFAEALEARDLVAGTEAGHGGCTLARGRLARIVCRMSITLEVDEPTLRALPLGPGERERHMQIELACRYYAKGWLSFGQGAKMAALDHHAFACELAERDIPRNYTMEEALEDVAHARRQ